MQCHRAAVSSVKDAQVVCNVGTERRSDKTRAQTLTDSGKRTQTNIDATDPYYGKCKQGEVKRNFKNSRTIFQAGTGLTSEAESRRQREGQDLPNIEKWRDTSRRWKGMLRREHGEAKRSDGGVIDEF